MYLIPSETIKQFELVASENYSSDGQHVETLAYLVGYKSNDNFIASHLIFPEQQGSCSSVDDKGKYNYVNTFFYRKLEAAISMTYFFGKICQKILYSLILILFKNVPKFCPIFKIFNVGQQTYYHNIRCLFVIIKFDLFQ